MRPVGQPKRIGPRLVWRSVASLLGSACALLSVAPANAATKAPEVGYLSASHVTATSAVMEVPINPEGIETSYEIWLECQSAQVSSQSCEPLTVGSQRQQGVLPASYESHIVTDEVTGLQPGYLYKYGVIATNSAGREGFVGDGFLTCPSQSSCPSQPFLSGESLWVIEGAERAAKETPRIEAEEVARKKEAEERPVKEAAERAAKEHAIWEAGERAGKEAAERAALAHAPRCVVPRLKGDSLAAARRALGAAHCRLGRLSEPRHHRGRIVVVKQSVRRGSRLAGGSRVALTLGKP
jgi:hypothetical protein